MTDLTRRTLLDPLALDGRDYFASLLAEGQRCGLLSDRDLSRLQGESLTAGGAGGRVEPRPE